MKTQLVRPGIEFTAMGSGSILRRWEVEQVITYTAICHTVDIYPSETRSFYIREILTYLSYAG